MPRPPDSALNDLALVCANEPEIRDLLREGDWVSEVLESVLAAARGDGDLRESLDDLHEVIQHLRKDPRGLQGYPGGQHSARGLDENPGNGQLQGVQPLGVRTSPATGVEFHCPGRRQCPRTWTRVPSQLIPFCTVHGKQLDARETA